jgi:predicted Rossmann fold nucleotide-binding protein DprA/Smf involved in DNA uptake
MVISIAFGLESPTQGGYLDRMNTAAYARPARSTRASAIDYLALTGIKGLGDEGIAHVLAEIRRTGGTVQAFLHSPPGHLQDQYGLRATVAKSLARQIEPAMKKAVELFERANALGIAVLAPSDAAYPRQLHEFYGDEPPLLYAYGNVSLLSANCVALVNSAKPSARALEHTLGLASRLAEAGQILVGGTESPSYNVVGLAAKRAGASAITVCHHGLFALLKSGQRREPAPLARFAGEQFDPSRSLLISPFRLDGRWQSGNGPRRDKLVVAIAQRVVAVEVSAGGKIEGLCRQAARLGRRVFVCQTAESGVEVHGNEAILADGAAPLVADSIGSNVDLVLGPENPPPGTTAEPDDLERRKSIGQYFTPPEVADFIWKMTEVLRDQAWASTARIIDPACGEGVFVRAAIERGHDPGSCFGVDIDETLIPVWQREERFRRAHLFRTNGLVDNPSIGLTPASFDLVIGNPPFSGRGLRDLLRLVQPPTGKSSRRERSLFGDEPNGSPAKNTDDGAKPLCRHERAILDYLARHLIRYACWRLRGEADEAAEDTLNEPDRGGLFADLDLSAERPIRASDYERMAQAVADWPADRLLDPTQAATREAVRRLVTIAIEVFFTERFVQLAKPGGVVAMIVPESILASDQLGPLRKWLMQKIQLMAVVGLPQKVFTGVGAKAKTGIVFARRYTADEEEENAKARGTRGLAEKFHDVQILMVAPNTDSDEWSLRDYFSDVTSSAAKIGAANAKPRTNRDS